MIVVVCILCVALGAALISALVVLDRTQARHADERKHLTHIAIARHAGEVLALDREPTDDDREDRAFVHIEGLT